jgi:outer membrane beta-barrel protein
MSSAALWIAILSSAAEDELDMGHFVAAEPRVHRLVHELRATAGIFPIDAFRTAISVGGAYAVHLSDVFAWEVLSFEYAANVDTGIEARLASEWSISPASESPALQYVLGTHLLAAPLYGKLAVFDEDILYASAHFSLGGGLAHYEDAFRPILSFGPGTRFFIGSNISLRFDLRAAVVPDSIYAGAAVSLSWSFGKQRVTETEISALPEKHVDPLEVLDQLYPPPPPPEER